jgi:hypothetical protein
MEDNRAIILDEIDNIYSTLKILLSDSDMILINRLVELNIEIENMIALDIE